MAAPPATVHRFTAAERLLFASLSGDVNPMHVDPIAARRTQAGAPVVHGMHMVLWAVDALIGAGCIARPVATLRVQFQKFVYDGDEVTLSRIRLTEAMLRASLVIEGVVVAALDVGFGPLTTESAALLSTHPVSTAAPAVLDLPDLPGRAGWLPDTMDKPIARLFPRVAECLGPARVEALARISALVGMVCPGMHSMSASYSIRIARAEGGGLSFKVQDVDERFRRTEIAVAGSGIIGTVTAFLRQPPVEQRTMNEISGLIAAGEFRGSTALIVGGSRGLGALTARVLAAGGGRVIVTYVVGEVEARDIAAEIGPDACRVLHYDARQDAANQLARLDWEVNQLYYFATPQMFRQKTALYIPSRFAEFCQIYVDGFQDICAALLARSTAQLSVFYPSSTAVERHPQDIVEFSMAKAAGEILCADMNRFLRGLRITISRLPRVLTDQTATVTPVQSSDALDVMLPLIRDMHAEALVPSPATRIADTR